MRQQWRIPLGSQFPKRVVGEWLAIFIVNLALEVYSAQLILVFIDGCTNRLEVDVNNSVRFIISVLQCAVVKSVLVNDGGNFVVRSAVEKVTKFRVVLLRLAHNIFSCICHNAKCFWLVKVNSQPAGFVPPADELEVHAAHLDVVDADAVLLRVAVVACSLCHELPDHCVDVLGLVAALVGVSPVMGEVDADCDVGCSLFHNQ